MAISMDGAVPIRIGDRILTCIDIGDGYYAAAEGAVVSVKSGIAMLLQPCVRSGYEYVTLCRPGLTEKIAVHAAVLAAFFGPRADGQAARHLNGDPRDNAIGNLRWGSEKANARDAMLHGRSPRGAANGKARISEDDVHAIRARYDNGEQPAVIAKYYPISRDAASAIGRRASWKWLPEKSGTIRKTERRCASDWGIALSARRAARG